MANRSYLYAIDFDSTKGLRKTGEKIYGLSEYSYSIPLSYLILVSQDSKISNSINWEYEHPIAIQGDFEKGKIRLFNFLKELQKEGIFDKLQLEQQITETQDFLERHKLQYTILECCELYELDEGEWEDRNQELFDDIVVKIESQIMDFLDDFRSMHQKVQNLKNEIVQLSKPKSFLAKLFSSDHTAEIHELENKIKNIEQKKWDLLGINYWSDILYFHFENE